jgi:hypothetical protein
MKSKEVSWKVVDTLKSSTLHNVDVKGKPEKSKRQKIG